jgi:hypothetical protein
MVLNGKVTCDFDDPSGAKEGVIALQLHAGDPMEVRFKDISIKKLSPKKSPSTTTRRTSHRRRNFTKTSPDRMS